MNESSYREVALVTAALHDRLDACVKSVISGAKVVLGRPDSKRQAEPAPGLNLFLYEVLTNPFMSNIDDLSRMQPPHRGSFSVDLPLAALDLHYLLTFNGKEDAFEPLNLLGSVISNLAAQPEISIDEMRASVSARSSMSGARLPYPGEPVVLTPLNLNLEEMSRLWSVLLHEPFSLSLQYSATVVMLRQQLEAAPAPLIETIHRAKPGTVDPSMIEIEP